MTSSRRVGSAKSFLVSHIHICYIFEIMNYGKFEIKTERNSFQADVVGGSGVEGVKQYQLIPGNLK